MKGMAVFNSQARYALQTVRMELASIRTPSTVAQS